jgi:hypothetical protein
LGTIIIIPPLELEAAKQASEAILKRVLRERAMRPQLQIAPRPAA